MKTLIATHLLLALSSSFGLAAPTLFRWDNENCFRNSINFCEDDQIYVRDQGHPPRCGCLRPGEFLDADACKAVRLVCNKESGEQYAMLYSMGNSSDSIGCGCFATIK